MSNFILEVSSVQEDNDGKRKPLRSYRELDVWKKAIDLVEELYRVTRLFPKDEQFVLVSQMRRSAISIPSNIVEGYGRKDRGDYRRHVSIANGSLKELETQVIIAGRLSLAERDELDLSWQLLQDVGKMLSRLLSSLSR